MGLERPAGLCTERWGLCSECCYFVSTWEATKLASDKRISHPGKATLAVVQKRGRGLGRLEAERLVMRLMLPFRQEQSGPESVADCGGKMCTELGDILAGIGTKNTGESWSPISPTYPLPQLRGLQPNSES